MSAVRMPCSRCKIGQRRMGSSWCSQCTNEYNRRRRAANPIEARQYRRRFTNKYKQEAVDHYGGKCSCCGESELAFLQLDHINNDGAEWRRKYQVQGNSLYGWLKRHGWPGGFQVLCANCNRAKSAGGCPHLALATDPPEDTS